MASIIAVHIAKKDVDAAAELWPGMRIQVMDIVQPPGMTMPPDMDEHQQIVPAALAMNRKALIVRNTRPPANSLVDVNVMESIPLPIWKCAAEGPIHPDTRYRPYSS